VKKETVNRATQKSIKNCLLEATEATAKHYYKVSGHHLKKGPEYLIVVKAADYITKRHPALGYQLEVNTKEFCKGKVFEEGCELNQDFRHGRFDLVLTSKKTTNPRHIVEFKRTLKGTSLASDVVRIKDVAEAVSVGHRLESGFLVAVQKRKQDESSDKKFLDSRVEGFDELLQYKFKISHEYKSLGKGKYGCKQDEHILIVVFIISF
jgi:hypothetical protein